MNDVANSIWAMLLVLPIMIVIHELGHHVVAKFFGVRVEVFSVGFGKRLFGFFMGGTDYRVSLLPFGGYVKMAGENPMDERTGDPGEFASHPRWQRILIGLAGPAMNIIFAILLITGMFMVQFPNDASMDSLAVIGYVDPNGPGQKAGIEIGDRIIRIENVKNPLWQDVQDVLIRAKISQSKSIEVVLQRGEQIISTQIIPTQRGQQELDYLGIVPDEPIRVSSVLDDSPAFKAGLKDGDEIISMNSVSMRSMAAVKAYLKQNGEKTLAVKARRNNGQVLDLSITPSLVDTESGVREFRMGFASQNFRFVALPLPQAFMRSLEFNKRNSLLIVDILQKLLERKVSLKAMDGPIGIGREAGKAFKQKGWMPLLGLMAVISLNLGIFNLLPIPILDGGLILMLTIESIIRRDINQRIKERVYQTAFVGLVLFAVVVLYNDVTKLL